MQQQQVAFCVGATAPPASLQGQPHPMILEALQLGGDLGSSPAPRQQGWAIVAPDSPPKRHKPHRCVLFSEGAGSAATPTPKRHFQPTRFTSNLSSTARALTKNKRRKQRAGKKALRRAARAAAAAADPALALPRLRRVRDLAVKCLEPEVEEGNVEFKLVLGGANPVRHEQLVSGFGLGGGWLGGRVSCLGHVNAGAHKGRRSAPIVNGSSPLISAGDPAELPT